jgi:hypothetical protein
MGGGTNAPAKRHHCARLTRGTPTTAARTTAPPPHPIRLHHHPPRPRPRYPHTDHQLSSDPRCPIQPAAPPSNAPWPLRVSDYIQALPSLGEDIRREMAARTSERDRRQGGLRAAECGCRQARRRGVGHLRWAMGSARGWMWTARDGELQEREGTDGWAAVLDGGGRAEMAGRTC